MGDPNNHASLETLPDLVFDCYILKYLSPMDIFNLGRCATKLKHVVVTYTNHHVSISLQCIKSTYKHYYKTSTTYGDIHRFSKIDISGKINCECNRFLDKYSIYLA